MSSFFLQGWSRQGFDAKVDSRFSPLPGMRAGMLPAEAANPEPDQVSPSEVSAVPIYNKLVFANGVCEGDHCLRQLPTP